jgi:hypothetical protein
MRRFSIFRILVLGIVGWGSVWCRGALWADDVPQKTLSPPASSSDETPEPAVNIADPLAHQVEEAIQVTGRRFLDVDVHTPWQIVHGLLAYRQEYSVKQNGQRINALHWIQSGPSYKGQAWFEKTPYGAHAHSFNGIPYAFQGHPCQFLAYMTMCDLPASTEFKTGDGQTVTMGDFIKGAEMEVGVSSQNYADDHDEVTWTLWFLSHYLDPETRWTNMNGEPWSIERMVQMETDKNVARSACGGTHGLFALSYARNGYLSTGRRLTGVWVQADQKIQQYVEAARVNQNSDGTFSTNFFQGPGYSQDFEKRLNTSGHVLEFLMVALPRTRLSEEWVRRAVNAVSGELVSNRQAASECAALYHAVDALDIYRTRVWPELDPTRRSVVTAKPVAPAVPPPALTSPAIPARMQEPAPAAPTPAAINPFGASGTALQSATANPTPAASTP